VSFLVCDAFDAAAPYREGDLPEDDCLSKSTKFVLNRCATHTLDLAVCDLRRRLECADVCNLLYSGVESKRPALIDARWDSDYRARMIKNEVDSRLKLTAAEEDGTIRQPPETGFSADTYKNYTRLLSQVCASVQMESELIALVADQRRAVLVMALFDLNNRVSADPLAVVLSYLTNTTGEELVDASWSVRNGPTPKWLLTVSGTVAAKPIDTTKQKKPVLASASATASASASGSTLAVMTDDEVLAVAIAYDEANAVASASASGSGM